jgi:ABC-2 type transport system permease protein
MQAFVAQSKAEGLRLVRSPFFLLFSVLMPIAFYALFTFLNGADTEIGSTSWAAYSLMSMTAFSLIGTAAGQFGIRLSHERKDGLLKILRLTPMSTGAWVSAKLVSHLVIHLLIIVVMFLAASLTFGVEMSLGHWLACGLWLLLGSIPFLGLGILIGTIKSTDVATAVSNLLYMGISVAGGLWMPLETFPAWLKAIGQWLPSHAYANGAWNMLAGRAIELSDASLLIGYGLGFILLAMLIMNSREAA